MSGVLVNETEALREVNQKISAIERRLKNARAARDSYIDYLRSKYPLWRPSIPSSMSPIKIVDEDDIFSQLETTQHFWDIRKDDRRRETRRSVPSSKLYYDIPPNGPLLTSDLPRMRRRLEEINSQLRLLRDHRSIIPSEDYIQSILPSNIQPIVHESSDMVEIQQRLDAMAYSSTPVIDITQERIMEMKKKEEMDNLIQNYRSGNVSSILSSEPLQPQVTIPSYSIESSTIPQATSNQLNVPPSIQSSQPPPSSINQQSKVHFGENTQVPNVSNMNESIKDVEEKKPNEPIKETKTSYQQILSLLSRNDPEPESDSEEDKKTTKGGGKSFDELFGAPNKKVDFKSSPQIKSTLSMVNNQDDSDDDFFQ